MFFLVIILFITLHIYTDKSIIGIVAVEHNPHKVRITMFKDVKCAKV